MTHRAYLLLGSNVDAEANLPAAVALLGPHGLAAVSAAYETAAVGTRDGRPFLNAAALLATALEPADVKASVCRAIEARLGRRRDPADRFAPRTIDLDLALWDDAVLDLDGARIPDPDIVRHLHVARPLADLAPGYRHPEDGRTLAEIADALERDAPAAARPRRRGDLAGWPGPG